MLPCDRCHRVEIAARRLRDEHVQLGRVRRQVLWHAAEPWSGFAPYVVRGQAFDLSHLRDSDESSANRAATALRRLGLLHVARRRGRRYIWRTPLGHHIVRQYRDEFEASVDAGPGDRLPRIRWDHRLDAAVAASRLPRERLQAMVGAKLRTVADERLSFDQVSEQ